LEFAVRNPRAVRSQAGRAGVRPRTDDRPVTPRRDAERGPLRGKCRWPQRTLSRSMSGRDDESTRWRLGADSYGSDLNSYRRYLVNHEFGHTLGKRHVGCPGPGKVAPVMLQQTKGLRGCRKNPWPLASETRRRPCTTLTVAEEPD
jgi:hypothetical protein